MDIGNRVEPVKTDFDFGWKSGINIQSAELAFRHNRGDIIDVGCGTCQLLRYLREKGWKGEYYGIDLKKYEGRKYPENVHLIVGNVFSIVLPKVKTAILYNILEHVDEPTLLLSRVLKTAENVLINVPKRNEELWKHGIAEYHQLDKTHKHCGFSSEELYNVVNDAGGEIINLVEHTKIDATIGATLWKSRVLRLLLYLTREIFSSKVFNTEI